MSETTTTSTTVPVLLLGGPDDWHGRELHLYTREELEGPREDLGTYLVSSGVPASHPDMGARAAYEPDAAGPAQVWWFRGWVPAAPASPGDRPEDLVDATVVYGSHGVPVYWMEDDGQEGQHEVVRLLAHWEAEDDCPAVWRVRATTPAGQAGVWEIHEHAGGRATAGRVPTPTEDDTARDLLLS